MEMNHLFRSKLLKRNLLISLCLTFLALLIVFIVTNYVMYHSIREEIENRNQLMAKTIGKNTDETLLNIINDMTIIAEYTRRLDENPEQILIEMEQRIFSNPLYYYAKVFDENKKTVTNLPNVHFPETEEDHNIIERMSWSQTFFISNMFILENGQETIAVSYPIFDKKGTYRGGVIGYINLHMLSRYLSQVKIGENGINALIDRNGNVIGSNVENYIGLNLAHHELGENLYKDKRGIWDGEIFDETMLFAYQPTQRGNFGVLVGEPITQAIAPVKQLQNLLMVIFSIGIILTFIFTSIATLNIVKPITNLTKQAREYKDSNRNKFHTLQTGDELEELSVTMDEMANELKKKEKDLSHILESIPYGVITTDREGHIVTFNKGAEKLTLYSRKEVIGKKVVDLPFKRDREEFINLKTLLNGNKFDDVESYILDKNGKRYDVKIYSALFYDDKDKIIGSIMILRDVSKVKKMEEDLKRAEYMASLGRLTAGVAHEIKNPLSIIQAAAEAIKIELGNNNKTFISELTDDILETSDRMNKLLAEFLKLSKGNIDNEREIIDIIDLLDDLLTLVKKQFEKSGITVKKEYLATRTRLLANKNQLNQLFLNIIINSIEALKYGGDLSIKVHNEADKLIIACTDTGSGIKEEDLNLIFEPFYTTKKTGTGLGLSIAYEIVQQHHGTIEVNSSLDIGTSIKVSLPHL